MPQQSKVHKRETMIQDVFVSAIHIESDFMYVQIYDYALQDCLHSFMFDCALTETQVVECLGEIASMITEKTYSNLLLRYTIDKYAFYKELGEVSNFQEFITFFKKELDERMESKNERS